jgi:P pilus assembly chaperone PapD
MSRLFLNLLAKTVRHCETKRIAGPHSASFRYVLLLCLGACWPLHEALADLMLNPTRVVFDKNVRSAQLDLINNGTETATYRITFVNRRMSETGQFSEVDVPLPGELFSESLVRFSPRQVTLAPGAAQTVRVLLRKPADLPPGEYRSHLLFQRVADGEDSAVKNPDSARGNELDIRLKALVSVSVPVIVRHGETTVSAEVEALALQKGAAGEPVLALELHRKGSRSLYGDVIVTFAPRGATQVGVGRVNGVAVYSPNALRSAKILLQPPRGIDLAHGTLRVVFRERPDDGGKVLAERTLQLP